MKLMNNKDTGKTKGCKITSNWMHNRLGYYSSYLF